MECPHCGSSNIGIDISVIVSFAIGLDKNDCIFLASVHTPPEEILESAWDTMAQPALTANNIMGYVCYDCGENLEEEELM